MKERKLETIVWDVAGETVEGRLISMKPVRFRDGGMNLQYRLRKTDGTILMFMGASQLNAKLTTHDVGCNISIEYLGEDTGRQMQEGNNRPKLFRVFVEEGDWHKEMKAKLDKLESTEITDDDIPF